MKLARRVVFTIVSVAVFTLVSLQFAHIIDANVAMARSLSGARRDIVALQVRRRKQEREIHRLLDPDGAVPDIHERLHLLRPNEAIIYLKPARVRSGD